MLSFLSGVGQSLVHCLFVDTWQLVTIMFVFGFFVEGSIVIHTAPSQ